MNEKNENLKEVLSGIVGAEEASQMVEDISAGDALIDRFDSPVPDAAVVSGIKKQIGSRLWLRKQQRVVRRTSEMAVAAVLVVAVLLSAVFMQNRSGIDKVFSLEMLMADEDPEYSLLAAQVADMEASLLSIGLDDDNEQEIALFDVEMGVLELGNGW